MQIRQAAANDMEAIYAFICDLEETTFDFEIFNQLYCRNIAGENNIYLVAEDESTNKVIGFISCHGQILLHHLGMVYEIQEMFVDLEFRSLGIGHLLIGALEERLRDRECRSLEVSSNAKRTAAHEFYIRNGFIKSHVKLTKEW
ncbi:GNAT family N-acetyltransferase [Pseudoflavitalea rhizosphaerae]|uniref:GNAT family N-acetyltransferase n=1 Tax=Pseudoflavitalea rhizosphaerae TaxID=1884793 RepID=UPI000F8CC60B|nr:GNAT family N-acetyltransferase [Pseudoflavitalea rhizosphaerae]